MFMWNHRERKATLPVNDGLEPKETGCRRIQGAHSRSGEGGVALEGNTEPGGGSHLPPFMTGEVIHTQLSSGFLVSPPLCLLHKCSTLQSDTFGEDDIWEKKGFYLSHCAYCICMHRQNKGNVNIRWLDFIFMTQIFYGAHLAPQFMQRKNMHSVFIPYWEQAGVEIKSGYASFHEICWNRLFLIKEKNKLFLEVLRLVNWLIGKSGSWKMFYK